jgi:hypothetical protein
MSEAEHPILILKTEAHVASVFISVNRKAA